MRPWASTEPLYPQHSRHSLTLDQLLSESLCRSLSSILFKLEEFPSDFPKRRQDDYDSHSIGSSPPPQPSADATRLAATAGWMDGRSGCLRGSRNIGRREDRALFTRGCLNTGVALSPRPWICTLSAIQQSTAAASVSKPHRRVVTE